MKKAKIYNNYCKKYIFTFFTVHLHTSGRGGRLKISATTAQNLSFYQGATKDTVTIINGFEKQYNE